MDCFVPGRSRRTFSLKVVESSVQFVALRVGKGYRTCRRAKAIPKPFNQIETFLGRQPIEVDGRKRHEPSIPRLANPANLRADG